MATFVCPACWKVTDVPDEMAGRRVRCPDCHAIGPAQPMTDPAAPPAPAAPAAPRPGDKETRRPGDQERASQEEEDGTKGVSLSAGLPVSPSGRSGAADTRRVVVVTAWSACLVWTLAVMLRYGWLMGAADSVVQQTALGVRACAWILGGYVLARAVHAIARIP